MNDKQKARKHVKRQLAAVSDEELLAASWTVRLQIETLLESTPTRAVLLYKALPKWREVDVSWLEDYAGLACDYTPSDSQSLPPTKEYDIIFVPLYGFTASGYRLGHGGGWYDRLLAMQPRALKVGVGLESGRIEFTPEVHDVPMDVIVTESQLLSYGK